MSQCKFPRHSPVLLPAATESDTAGFILNVYEEYPTLTNNLSPHERSMEDLNTFSSILFVDECLLDGKRSHAFQAAIENTVKKGDIVLDAGTGSGILALFAARAGAKKVYAIEVDEEAALLAETSIQANPEGKKIEIVKADVRSFRLKKPVDVLLMELLDTGLITEGQAPTLNALRQNKVIDTHTKLVPRAVNCAVELVEYDNLFYGFHMPLIMQSRNSEVDERVKKYLSPKAVYKSVDFSALIDTHVNETVKLKVTTRGILNGIRLSTETMLTPHLSLWETSDMNMPVVIPLEPRKVKKGEEIGLNIQYDMGKGYDSFSARMLS